MVFINVSPIFCYVCELPQKGHGLCNRHLKRLRKYGDPRAGKDIKPYLRKAPLAERFWHDVAITANPDKCWDWQGYIHPTTGYGQTRAEGRQTGAHRIAWFLVHGHWPEPCCLHRCDNRICCNPSHLFEGTQQDNASDMVAKGRHLYGERAWGCKLTAPQVRQIKQDFLRGELRQSLGKRYGVNAATIDQIILGNNWKHIEPFGDLRKLRNQDALKRVGEIENAEVD